MSDKQTYTFTLTVDTTGVPFDRLEESIVAEIKRRFPSLTDVPIPNTATDTGDAITLTIETNGLDPAELSGYVHREIDRHMRALRDRREFKKALDARSESKQVFTSEAAPGPVPTPIEVTVPNTAKMHLVMLTDCDGLSLIKLVPSEYMGVLVTDKELRTAPGIRLPTVMAVANYARENNIEITGQHVGML